MGSILRWGRYPRGGNGNPLQYSCLENPMDRGAWLIVVHGVVKTERMRIETYYKGKKKKRIKPRKTYFQKMKAVQKDLLTEYIRTVAF